jgi:hypothetical protein
MWLWLLYFYLLILVRMRVCLWRKVDFAVFDCLMFVSTCADVMSCIRGGNRCELHVLSIVRPCRGRHEF